jgi:hypothetical protein
MTKFTELSAAAPVRTSIFHPEHPLHHLVLDLVEQVDETFVQWMAPAVARSTVEDRLLPDASPTSREARLETVE